MHSRVLCVKHPKDELNIVRLHILQHHSWVTKSCFRQLNMRMVDWRRICWGPRMWHVPQALGLHFLHFQRQTSLLLSFPPWSFIILNRTPSGCPSPETAIRQDQQHGFKSWNTSLKHCSKDLTKPVQHLGFWREKNETKEKFQFYKFVLWTK